MQTSQLIAANLATVSRFLDGTHSGKLDVIDETVAEDIVTEGFPGGSNPYDRESYKQFFRNFGAAFSDMGFRVMAMVADAERVGAHFEVEVTHTGAFAGIAPTGKRVRFTGMAMYQLKQGRIAQTTLQLDELGLLAQLGALNGAAAA